MSEKVWEEIHGFASPGEYDRFLQYIEEQVRAGHAREIDSDPNYGRGEIYGGRWFEDSESRELWRLVPPDFPFTGLWELIRK